MALSFNNCSFSGSLGKDPDVRYFEDGKMVANFSIAVNGRGDSTLWMPVKVWGKQAQVIADCVRKGSQIIVSGELENETWKKDGEERSRMALNCRNFSLIGPGKKGEGGSSGGGRSPGATSRPARNQAPEDEELPF